MSIIKKGDKYNRLTAIEFHHKDIYHYQCWVFCCDCGKEKILNASRVKTERIKSCGCSKLENVIKHGMEGTKIYHIWQKMKQRCLNPKATRYKDWGGRGIMVCSEWLKFENFYKDMGDVPEKLSLDRINNNEGYYKENCKWSTKKEQMNNTRHNHLITYQNKTQNIKQWSEELKINYKVLWIRINRNWSIKKALNK